MSTSKKQRVCVIGAGASGLCALRNLTAEEDKFDTVAYERNLYPGGIWNYTERTDTDQFGLPVHAAMYYNLTSVIPKEINEIPGFPYPKEWRSYITRQQVLEYLYRFMDHFDLRKYIKLHTIVRDVTPLELPDSKKVIWNVSISDTRKLDEILTERFDSVFVCIGHNWNKYTPSIPGNDEFEGRILHGRDYRYAEDFDGLDVALLGMGFTGIDVSMQVATKARKVYACHGKDNFPESFPKHIEQRPPFVKMTKNSVIFPDGNQVQVDAVIFCTGYRYSFPFLKDGIIKITQNRVTPIYKHLIHIKYPSLIFFNIARHASYFTHFNEFAKFAVRLIDGRIQLPSEEAMLKESEEQYQALLKEGFKPHYAHFNFGHHQWRHNRELAELGGFEPLPSFFDKLYRHVSNERKINITHYKEINYEIEGEDSFRILSSEFSKS